MTHPEKMTSGLARPKMALGTLVLALLCFTAPACFEEPKPECAFACSAEDECPEDYRCVSDGWCKRNDIPFEYACSPASLLDAAAFDSARADADPADADPADADLSSVLPNP
jgi:hypothetical protein